MHEDDLARLVARRHGIADHVEREGLGGAGEGRGAADIVHGLAIEFEARIAAADGDPQHRQVARRRPAERHGRLPAAAGSRRSAHRRPRSRSRPRSRHRRRAPAAARQGTLLLRQPGAGSGRGRILFDAETEPEELHAEQARQLLQPLHIRLGAPGLPLRHGLGGDAEALRHLGLGQAGQAARLRHPVSQAGGPGSGLAGRRRGRRAAIPGSRAPHLRGALRLPVGYLPAA